MVEWSPGGGQAAAWRGGASAKDLVYLQDVMGAGADVEAVVHQDLVAISKPGRHVVSKAINSLDAVLKSVTAVEEASRELAERDTRCAKPTSASPTRPV